MKVVYECVISKVADGPAQQTILGQEVIRCKNCRHYAPEQEDSVTHDQCFREIPPRIMPPLGFCSEAEHKQIEMKMEEA